MPFLTEDDIAKLLKAPLSDNIWLIYGDDGFLKDHYCNKLISACVNEELKFFNFHTYNDDESSLDEIFADADNLPVMSDKTCLLIKNYPLCDLGEKQLADFAEKLGNIPDTTVMIFFYNTHELIAGKNIVPKWEPAVNIINDRGMAVNLSHRTQNKMAKMLVARAKDRGTSIGEQEASYLIELVGDDMQNLLNEFNKVCSYADGSPVTKEMIDQTAIKTIDANVFDISSSIFSGDTDKAFAVTNELLRIKTPVQPIIGALAKTYTDLYRFKCALKVEKSYEDFAPAMGYKGSYSYSFRQLTRIARSCSMQSVRKALDILLETDVKSKSTAFDPTTLMSELIARLAEATETR